MLRQGLMAILLLISFLATATPIYQPSQMEVIHKRGYIRVGVIAFDHAPFIMHHKDGKLSGVDIDLAKEVANLLGVKILFDSSATTYEQLLQNMFNKKDDIVISALLSVPSRAKSVFFSKPYYRSPIGLLVNRVKYDNFKKDDIASFNNNKVKIGVIIGGAYISYIKSLYPKAQIVPFNSTNEVLVAVSMGQIDACMIDDLVVKVWLAQKPERAIRTRYLILQGFYASYAIATSYSYPWLGEWLSNVVDSTINIGLIDSAIQKYTENDIYGE